MSIECLEHRTTHGHMCAVIISGGLQEGFVSVSNGESDKNMHHEDRLTRA